MASRRPSQLWHAWALLFWDAVLFFAEDPGPMPGRTLEEVPEPLDCAGFASPGADDAFEMAQDDPTATKPPET